jgi:predicted dehydrogenase
VHWMDQLLWWTEETHPKSVYSTAGRFVREDSTDAPDTQIVTYEFETFSAIWEQRHYAANNAEQHLIGAYFYGTEGTFHMGWRDGWTFYPAKKSEKIIHVEPKLNDPDGQNIKELWADFLDAIKYKRRAVRDIEIGYRATAAALLGMVSWRAGRSVKWDGAHCPNDPVAEKLLRRAYRKPWEYPV